MKEILIIKFDGVLSSAYISETLNSLITEVQPATLMTNEGEQLTPKDRDICRAEYIRKKLN